MTRSLVFISLLGSLFGGPARAEFEKMPGATNAAVMTGEPARFLCQPLDSGVFVNERGETWKKDGKKDRKLSTEFSETDSGTFVDYLECFVVAKDIVAAFHSSDGEGGGISIRRGPLGPGKMRWNIRLAAMNLAPPKLNGSQLTLSVSEGTFVVDVEKGMVISADSPGCVIVSRWPKVDGEVHRRMGKSCGPSASPVKK